MLVEPETAPYAKAHSSNHLEGKAAPFGVFIHVLMEDRASISGSSFMAEIWGVKLHKNCLQCEKLIVSGLQAHLVKID